MAKIFVACFDATGNKPDRQEHETKVVKLCRSILGSDRSGVIGATPNELPDVPAVKWYDRGGEFDRTRESEGEYLDKDCLEASELSRLGPGD